MVSNIIILDRLFNTWHWCVCVNIVVIYVSDKLDNVCV